MSFRDLVDSLNSTCSLVLQRKVNTYLQDHLETSTVFMINILPNANEGVVQVIGDSVLQEEFRFTITNVRSSIEFEGSIQKLDAKLKQVLYPYNGNVLKVPITHPEEEGLICIIVCVVDPMTKFSKDGHCTMFIQDCMSGCSALLLNAFIVKEEKHMKDLYQSLLDIAKESLLTISDHNELLKKIVIEARIALNAEQCSLFLLSEDKSELIGQIFDGVPFDQVKGIRVPITNGIIGHVALRGEIIVVPDAHDLRFFPSDTKPINLKQRNVLCFPIRDEVNQVIGVVEITNKKNGQDFTYFDEKLAAAFGVYFGIAMMQSIAHRKIEIIRACSNMSSELVNYHMAKGQEELQLLFTYEPRIYYREMFDFQWTCRQVAWSDTISCLLSMFHHLGFAKSLNISKTTLLTFIMTARVTYRDLPYHNWAHAFSVAHFSFVLMHHLQLIRRCLITEVEGAAFFISALCHDLDHRGTTNSFQIIANNSLAYLYGSEGSILERHHFSTTLRILNTDNCNLFENFTVPQYARVVNLIRDMIVATDMNQHLQILPEQRKAISLGTYEPGKKYHRFLLTSLMMTCCDLNDQVKGWIYCRDVAEKISLEFFNQGDMEKEMGRTPVDMMDRDRAFIPRVQLNFVNDICVPCYTVVVSLFPELEGLLDSIKDTAYRWKRAIEWFKLNAIPENLSLGFIFNSDLVQYVLER